MSTSGRLTKLYEETEHVFYDRDDRYVVMSDCHRGIGDSGDNFLKNRNIFLAALRYYNQKKFTYVELGDGDELWENKEMKDIIQVHREVYEMMEKFYKEGRLYMLYGNHDIQKRKEMLFPGLKVKEGVVLEECGTGRRIFLVHGHQGDLFNDALWRVNRFLVRYVWRKLELLGFENPMSTSGNGKKKTKVEQRLKQWADDNHQIMIAGHTHRTKFSADARSFYFNDGSCVGPHSVTAIEIEDGMLRLVEWGVMTKKDYSMYIGRKLLEEVRLERFEYK